MSAPLGYRELLETCALVNLPPQSCLLLSGDDALEWLNGQVTRELRDIVPGETRAACLCSVTGQIEAVLLIARFPGRIAIQTFADTASRLSERVENSVFMEDVRVEAAPAGWELIAIQGPSSAQLIAQMDELPSEEAIVFSLRQRAFTWSAREGSISMRLPLASTEASEAIRIENGEPMWCKDIDSKTLPAELGSRFLEDHVSFTKGCYTGQEVLMRMHSRGHANRSWVALLLEKMVEAGTTISSASREKAGKVTSTAVSPEFGPIAAAMLHKDSAIEGSDVEVQTETGPVKGKVRMMPLRASE